MGKLLIIKGADFSKISLTQVLVGELEMVLFNEPSDGKFKVNGVPSGPRLEVLHLPDAASNWQVEWIDIRKYIGKNRDSILYKTLSYEFLGLLILKI